MGVNAAASKSPLCCEGILHGIRLADGQAVATIPPFSALNSSNSASLHMKEVHPKNAPFDLSRPRDLLSVIAA